MNPGEMEGTLNWFANPASKVSAHWVIARDGRAARVIPDNFSAWHAQEHNVTHWGIELEQGVEGDGFTDAQIAKLILVCQGYVEDFGVPAVHAMNGFVGHQETAQGRRVGKSDPGVLFPWGEFIAALNPTYTPLPTNEEAAHAIGFLYSAYWHRDRDSMHPYDRDVLNRINEWLQGRLG